MRDDRGVDVIELCADGGLRVRWNTTSSVKLNAFLALAIVLGAARAPDMSDSFTTDRVVGSLGRQLDAQLQRFAGYGFSGTVLVVKQDRIVLLKGYGLANIERGIPNTGATRFEMNSMTKIFTGAAILQLVAEGHLRLGDPVAPYLDGLPPSKQGATVEQLATHTSGLIVKGVRLAGDSRENFIRDIARTPLESPPGQRYRYTNAGFSLLAAIIETVSGETYEQYLRRHLFAAAGMDTALFRNDVPPDDSLFAHGYVGTPAGLEPGPAEERALADRILQSEEKRPARGTGRGTAGAIKEEKSTCGNWSFSIA